MYTQPCCILMLPPCMLAISHLYRVQMAAHTHTSSLVGACHACWWPNLLGDHEVLSPWLVARCYVNRPPRRTGWLG
ncbi:hypothetical protein V8C37DRAFT_378915 [Trichoderma ceciliae]